MSTLYILQLRHGKWYVGKTDNIHQRFHQHVSGSGSAWTSLHEPIRIYETRQIKSLHDETNLTKDLMKKYGVDNVRGGAYCQVDLPEATKHHIEHELHASTDMCFRCGKPGHFANKCRETPPKQELVWCCDYCDREFTTRFGCMVHEKSCSTKKGACYRCGRKSHYSPDCYASTHIDGYELSD
jgi:predicted GIY-YIG superfamily endonuclease